MIQTAHSFADSKKMSVRRTCSVFRYLAAIDDGWNPPLIWASPFRAQIVAWKETHFTLQQVLSVPFVLAELVLRWPHQPPRSETLRKPGSLGFAHRFTHCVKFARSRTIRPADGLMKAKGYEPPAPGLANVQFEHMTFGIVALHLGRVLPVR